METSSPPCTDTRSVVCWLQKQTVFVSGGTGFLGKALIFKLLKCGVSRIFVLIRPKKGKLAQERLDSILKEPIFESLTANDPFLRDKLIAIAGDVTQLGLGISEEDRVLLQNEVTVLFSAAASVKFDDPLKLAVMTNLRSTRDTIQLAKGMKNLKMFHLVSTAYSNADHVYSSPRGITEELYERKMDWEKLIDFIENTPEELVDAVSLKLMGACANTYAFTKHLAEAVVEDAAKDIPVMITRPQIVVNSKKEPLPGWLDNVSSPVAIIGGSGKGVLRVYFGTSEAEKSYLPVDTCINCIITSTWREVVLRPKKDSGVAVYNTKYKPITTGTLYQICSELNDSLPMHNAIWHFHFMTVNNRHAFLALHILLHFLPGLFFDIFLTLSGNKLRMSRIYRKIYMALSLLLPFLNLDDNFVIDNYLALQDSVPEHEKKLFDLEPIPDGDGGLSGYMAAAAQGFRTLIGDPPVPSKEDFVHSRRLYWLDKAFITLCGAFLLWLVPLDLVLYPFVLLVSSLINFYDSL